MDNVIDNIEFVVGNKGYLENIINIKVWRPFDKRTIDFCDKISKELMKLSETRTNSDLLSLAFWLRKSNIQGIAKQYTDLDSSIGQGLVFHIAPGNMAMSFAYSLFTGLLTGNTNIIRLPSRKFYQADVFCDTLSEVLEKDEEMAERICLITYQHDKHTTDWLSGICHMRIVWGGDNTVNTIRQSVIRPRTSEITFSNRFSICVIDADEYLDRYNPKKTAHDFYIDTYLTDQNACSSPRIIYWMGENIDKAKDVFWDALYSEIENYDIADVTVVDKLMCYCKMAAYKESELSVVNDYRIMRIEVKDIDETVIDNIGNSGFFYECNIDNLEEILDVCKRELQTVSYIGIDKERFRTLVLDNGVEGVDRIVPVGKTMDFDFYWDGKDIIRTMTRRVSLF